jgi:imidazolonepropionase-like amidohydrolase/Tol biopolymer transport system component
MTVRTALLWILLASVAWAGEEPETAPKWDVDDPGGPYRELALDVTEGTWMSVDVHPDGSRLVFDLLGDVWTLPIEGGDATLLSGGLAYDIQPRWSPDGKSIAFTSDRGGGDNVWLMQADGGNRRALTTEDFRLLNNAVWHPSGDYVVAKKHFTSGRSLGAGEMWMYRLPAEPDATAGTGVRLTERKNDQQDVGEPAISPDGRFLYWSEDMSGGTTFQYNKDPHGTIYVIRRLDMETGELRDLIRLPGGAVRPEPSPDGKSLAFVRRERNQSVLAVLDLGSGKVRNVWDGLSLDQQETWAIFGPYPGFDWTPDSASIVVWAQGGLHRVNVADGTMQAIPFRCQTTQRMLPLQRIEHSVAGETFDVKVIRWPQETAEGTVVFSALGHLYRTRGSDAPERITDANELEFAPRVVGDTIVYVTWSDTRGGRVKTVGVDGANRRTVVSRPGHYFSADLSPDGTELVYHRARGDGFRGGQWDEEPGIYRVKLRDDAEPRFLTRFGRKPRFAPDGRRILLLAREGDKSALVSIDRIGSDRRVLATSERARDFEVSPDGRWIAFEELWQTYVAPFPPQPRALALGPQGNDVPVRRLSYPGGTYLSWSADSKSVRWSLGPDLFSVGVEEAMAGKPAQHEEPTRGVEAGVRYLGWAQPADEPKTLFALRHATVLPMNDMSVIEDGVVVVRGNRIEAVGKEGEVEIPAGAEEIDCRGQVVMPGLVDVHAHTGSASAGILPQQDWKMIAQLAFGVTATHDPSNNTQGIYAESERIRAGMQLGPRLLSTGTILYGADGDFKAVIDSLADARQEIARTVAWGPVSVKSYNQPRRDQRQQVMAAARELGIMVMPEGGSTLHYNMTHLLDGHTTLEHAVPVAPMYEPELRLLSEWGGGYTPTLGVGYGGLMGENYWYAKTKVWENERLARFVPRSVVDPNARRRVLATDDGDYHHIRLARMCAEVQRRGGHVGIGAHGQLQGLAAHWEFWMFVQGGMTPHEALRCATYEGTRAICLEHELGAVKPGYLADLIVVDGAVLEDVYASERISHVVANGRLYDARTMEQLLPERVSLPPGPPLDSIHGGGDHAHCVCGRGPR